jgi:flagellar motor switch protein FliG
MSVTVVRPPAARSLDKAALIMLALDEERSQRLFAGLEETEIRLLSRAMSRLGRTPLELIEQTVGDFREEISRTGNVVGTVEGTERILLRIMPPEKVASIMGDIRGTNSGAVWERLAGLPAPALVSYLRNEYPQTIAVVLAQLPPERGAHVLGLLPQPVADEVAVRLLRMDRVQQSVLSQVEAALERELIATNEGSEGQDSASVLAELLNRSDKDMVARVLATLEETDPDGAARVRRLMFTFEDLIRIDPATFGVLIAESSVDKLAIALHSAGAAIRELFLSSMSERAANMLKDEIETMPAPRRKAVDEAQTEIVELAKRLAEEGRIAFIDAADDA